MSFCLNESQLRLYEVICAEEAKKKPIRIIILKSRQMGFSTLTEGMIYKKTATRKLRNALIITHKDEATSNLFNMSKLFYEKSPEWVRPMLKNSNAKELIFENPTKNPIEKKNHPGLKSKIKCTTAGGKGVGRSDTLNYIHMSEVAFWPGDILTTYAGLMQAVPNTAGSMVIIESTANGFNAFKKMWDDAVAGRTDYVPLFFAWYEMQEYRMAYHGEELTEEERELQEAFGLDNEQIMWRRWCIANNCNNDLDMFKQEYPSTPEEAFLTTGDCVFKNKEEILLRIRALEERSFICGQFTYKEKRLDLDRIVLTEVAFSPDKKGEICIYKEPEKGIPYVIGGDTAGEGSDSFTAQVLDNRTGEQVARLKRTYDEDEYAKQLYCLGQYYNFALLAVEVNFTTHPIKLLEYLHYPKQYVREVFDTYTGATRKAFGFHTNGTTRPLLIAELVSYMKNSLHLVQDVETLREALTFIKNARGRPEAEVGEHDDLLMGLGIALMARGQQQVTAATPAPSIDKKHWTADMWQDWRNASPKDREYLLSKWAKAGDGL
ncbi:MAG: hypothetical protein PHG19_02525 [Anaerotignum sp.]|nr:hypothetical protein [Anaerotignum sp.]